MQKIKLNRGCAIKLSNHPKDTILSVGDDLTMAQAEKLVSEGRAEWHGRKNKKLNPVSENK